MQSFQELNEAIESANAAVSVKSNELADLRRAHKMAKATYEATYSRYLLETKARHLDWTVQEVKAQATNLAYEVQLEAIKAESAYHRAVGELKAVYTELECLKEQSYNMRQEMRRV